MFQALPLVLLSASDQEAKVPFTAPFGFFRPASKRLYAVLHSAADFGSVEEKIVRSS